MIIDDVQVYVCLSIPFDIIVDDSEYKIGSLVPYYHTEIKGRDIIYDERIKYVYILAWTNTSSIIKKHIEYIKRGGIFIKILPEIDMIDKDNYIKYM